MLLDLGRNDVGRVAMLKEAGANAPATVQLTPARKLTLEQCLDWIEDDELVEVTPESIRIRKRILDHSMREVARKKNAAVSV